MERYWVANGILASNECGGLVKYDDAQRALDAEREKVKEYMTNYVPLKALEDVEAQLATLQAQLRQVEGELANEKTAYKKLSEQWNKDNVDLSTFREVENDMKDE